MHGHIVLFNASQFQRRSSGAYRTANILRDMGFEVEVIDFVEQWDIQKLKEYVSKIVTPDTVAFAFSYTWMLQDIIGEYVQWLKKTFPGRKYFAGGQQPFQKYEGFDLVCTGFFEHAADPIIDYLFNNGPPPKHTMIHNGMTMLVNADTDYPAHSIRDLTVTYNHSDHIQPFEALTIELSRGCRFKCKYCSYAFLGFKKSVFRDPENVREELINNYNLYGVKNYIIADSTVNDDDDKLRMIADVVESLPFKPNFSAFVRVDLVVVRPYQKELLKRARIWAHFYGVETFHPVAAKAIGKGMSPSKIKRCLINMRKYFLDHLGLYRGSIGLIAGLPGEDEKSWHKTQKWMKKNWRTETWHWWPLDITNDSSNDNTNSLFSDDPAKYGYSKISDQSTIDALKNEYEQFGKLAHHRLDDHYFFWQNDQTNFYEASMWCSKMFSPENIFTVEPNFYIMNRLYSVENLRDALKLNVNIWDDKKIDTDTDPDPLDLYVTKKIESKHNQ